MCGDVVTLPLNAVLLGFVGVNVPIIAQLISTFVTLYDLRVEIFMSVQLYIYPSLDSSFEFTATACEAT